MVIYYGKRVLITWHSIGRWPEEQYQSWWFHYYRDDKYTYLCMVGFEISW